MVMRTLYIMIGAFKQTELTRFMVKMPIRYSRISDILV
jgi:hypothetical protein